MQAAGGLVFFVFAALALCISSPAMAADAVEYPGGATPDSAAVGEIVDFSLTLHNIGTEVLENVWLEFNIHNPGGTKIETSRTDYIDPDTQERGLLFWSDQGRDVPAGAHALFDARYSLGRSVVGHYFHSGSYILRYRVWEGQPQDPGAQPLGEIQEEILTINSISPPNISLPILMYHKVDDTAPEEYTVSKEEFEGEMKVLVAYGYQPVSTQEIYDYNYKGGSLPPKPVAITFDDGYQNVYTHAYPILMSEGLFAEFFIVTDVTVSSASERGYSKWLGDGILANPHMTWPEIIEMAANGMVIGSHTKSHPDLTTLTDPELEDELLGSKQEILSQAGITATSFAYPFGAGDGDPKLHQLLSTYDYNTAVAAWRGICQTSSSIPLDLRRVYIYGPHPASDPESSGISVNYDPDHPDDFFMTALDPGFPLPEITVESIEFLDSSGNPRQDNSFHPGETITVRITARNDGEGADITLSLALDDDGGAEPLVYDSHQTVLPEDIQRYFPPTTGSPETFEFLWEIPSGASAGAYDCAVEFHDDPYVLGFAFSGWNNDVFTVCDNIRLIGPANGAFLENSPTFSWDPGCDTLFVVQFYFNPGSGYILGTTPVLSEPSFVIPAWVWNFLPAYRRIYWRVWGADENVTPIRIEVGEEVYSFVKY